jgi:protein dithiol oxidoreductase (disulfide-forming)
MKFIKHMLAVMSLVAVAATAHASPQAPVNGTDYKTLDKAQTTDAPAGKVEVTEFFWYSCPHCFALDPSLNEWVKKQGNAIVFKRVPVAFRPSFAPQQKLYYTLEAMGRLGDLHPKVFHAIHAERKSLDTDAAIVDYMVAQGVDKAKFLEVYNSFGIQTKTKRAAQLQEAYKIDGVPTLAIDGRYITSPSIVGASLGNQPEPALHSAALQVAGWLVEKAAKEQSAKK